MQNRVVIAIIAGVLLGAVHAHAQECADRMRQALRLHFAPADSGTAVWRRMTVTAVMQTGAGPDSTVSEIETIERGELNIMRSDSLERWSDRRSIIVLDRRVKTLRIVDLAGRGAVVDAQQSVRDAFRDSLVDRARSVQCNDIPGARGIRIQVALEGEVQRFHNAAAITADVNSSGEIVRFAVTHPPGSAIRATTYVVLESDRNYMAIDISRPVLEHFFSADGLLRPEYEGYGVVHQQ